MNIREVTAFNRRDKIRKLVLPGFDGVPISHVIKFVLKGFTKGVLVTRASSIAFNLLMALLPASIFLFTLIPFIPIPNFQQELIRLFESILPANVFKFLETTIIDIITVKSGGLLLFMFIATVIFSTNGIHAVIHAFVVSAHKFKTRSWFDQRKISVVLLLIVAFMISIAGFLIIFGKMAVNQLVDLHLIERNLVIYVLVFLKWILIILLLFLAISFLYYLAPAKRADFKFFSPGSTLATLLFILTSLGFSAYVNNFGQYNKLYGSIGTLMVILIWLYLNSIALLIGFELNVSIKSARADKSENAPPFNCNE
ncbi:MAG TPA: YihY/virulence factor BrkB family protein [Bacteroidales bacterium]|nr:YihY/virulence factor BrkB family protein [Bacteroidales bacterium]